MSGAGAVCPGATQESGFRSCVRKKERTVNRLLFVFFGLFGDFVAGMRYILADTGDGVARAQERCGPEENDETGESDCKVLAHDLTPPCFGALSRAPQIKRASLAGDAWQARARNSGGYG